MTSMDFSDDDSEDLEDFTFDVSPRVSLLPSYSRDSKSLPAAACDDGDGDGWDSSDESCLPVIPAPQEEGGILYIKLLQLI